MDEKVKSALAALPNIGKLLFRLTRDPRVPLRNKIVFGGVAAYFLMPFDVIPDWIPGIGKVDDLLLVALGLDSMLNRVPSEILAEHWEGEEDVLQVVQKVIAAATKFVPDAIKDRLFSSASNATDLEGSAASGAPESVLKGAADEGP